MLKTFSRNKNFTMPYIDTANHRAVYTSAVLFLLTLFAFSVFGVANNVEAADTFESNGIVVVTTSGAAQKSYETPDIKKAATEQALKNAVADVLESVIERERVDVDPTIVETEIYSNAVNFIKNFKVLSEEQTIEIVEVPAVEPTAPGAKEPPLAGDSELTAPLPVEVVTHHIWIEAAIDTTSLRAALGDIIFADEEFIENISLVVLDLPDYAAYRTLMASLERITMIRSISYDSFTANRYAFELVPTGGINKLMRRITEEVGSDYIVTGTRKGTIIIKAAPTTISFKEYLESTNAD